MPTPWRIQLFGALQAHHGNQVITRFRTRKTGLLLACLAWPLGRSRRREELLEQLWPESDPDTARTQLRHQVYLLRRLLEPPGTPAGSVLLADRVSLRLNAEVVSTDVDEFEGALAAAKRAEESTDRAALLAQAVELYRGELLPGVFEDWVQQERQWLAERYFQALGELITHLERAREWERALEYACQGVRADPLREEAHRDLIRLLATAGQPEAALRQYDELVRILARDLAERPSDESRALANALRRQAAVASTTAAAQPPLPPPSVATSNLPLPLDRFFGRRSEMARLIRLLRPPTAQTTEGGEWLDDRNPTRLVTLTGPGGSGKTRLALEVARRLRQRWQGHVWFVPLVDLTDPLLIPNKLLDSLRIPLDPRQPPLEQAVGILAQRTVLLVMDNLDHLLPDGALLIQTMLQRTERTTVLATSRRLLGIAGEHVISTPPLPIPNIRDRLSAPASLDPSSASSHNPSVALFVDRVTAVAPGFRLTEENGVTVSMLCARLEGLPLAIELAASRAQVLAPAQILSQLPQRLDLLSHRSAHRETRHRSLRASLDYSYQFLPPDVRRFFGRLSIFRGGWTLESAEAVCEERCALDGLQQLHQGSLLVVEPSGEAHRYRFLETVREFAWEKLSDSGEVEALRDRHLEYFLRLAETAEPDLLSDRQTPWLRRLEEEHDNLRAALDAAEADERRWVLGLRLAGALTQFWYFGHHVAEGQQRLLRLLARTDNGTPGKERARARAAALAGAAQMSWNLGDARLTEQLARDTIAAANGANDLLSLSIGRAFLADCCGYVRGELDEAIAHIEMSVAGARELSDPFWFSLCLTTLGHFLCLQGEANRGRALMEEAIAIAREIPFVWLVALELTIQASMNLDQGQFAAAAASAAEALVLQRQRAAPWDLALSVGILADAVGGQGNAVRAAQILGVEAKILEGSGVSLHPGRIAARERTIATLRDALNDPAFAAAWEEGRQIPPEAAIDFVLGT